MVSILFLTVNHVWCSKVKMRNEITQVWCTPHFLYHKTQRPSREYNQRSLTLRLLPSPLRMLARLPHVQMCTKQQALIDRGIAPGNLSDQLHGNPFNRCTLLLYWKQLDNHLVIYTAWHRKLFMWQYRQLMRTCRFLFRTPLAICSLSVNNGLKLSSP